MLPFCDCHCHTVDFRQTGINLSDLIGVMDESNIRYAAVFGLPLKIHGDANEKADACYYTIGDSRVNYWPATDRILLDQLDELPLRSRTRLFPFLCGFIPTDMYCLEGIEETFNRAPDVWAGIGEIILRHDKLTWKTEMETARADHPAMRGVYDFAAERDLPVLLHSNIGTDDNERKLDSNPVYVRELRTALENHPKARFIWAHAGVSYGISFDRIPDIVGGLLAEFDNLWIDLSWDVFLQKQLKKQEATQHWLDLINKYDSRFMIGTDAVGKSGIEKYASIVLEYRNVISGLETDAQRKVGFQNFLDVLPKKMRPHASLQRSNQSENINGDSVKASTNKGAGWWKMLRSKMLAN